LLACFDLKIWVFTICQHCSSCFHAACFSSSGPHWVKVRVRSHVIASVTRISAQDFRFPFLVHVFFIGFISCAPLLVVQAECSVAWSLPLRLSLSSEPLLHFRSRPRQRPSFLADCWFHFSCRARNSSSYCPSCCLALRPIGSYERPPEALLRLSLISSGQDSSFGFPDW
jgi:hypothetical protein